MAPVSTGCREHYLSSTTEFSPLDDGYLTDVSTQDNAWLGPVEGYAVDLLEAEYPPRLRGGK